MASPVQVQIEITANAKQVQAQIASLSSQLKGLGGAAGVGFGQAGQHAESFQQQMRTLVGRFSQLWLAVKSFQGVLAVAKEGFDFNAIMEDSKLGMAALIMAQTQLKDNNGKLVEGQHALTAAMALSEDQIKKLRVAGLQTAATTEQLVGAYQDALGAGLRTGMSLDQIRVITIQTVQAAQAMQVPMTQLNQEIRSILEGTIDRNSRVALRLGITNADVNRWKEAGTLFENLNKRMGAFSEAGKASMNNWSVLLSNIKEAGQLFLGEAFKDAMGDLKRNLAAVLNTVFDLKTAGIAETFRPTLDMAKDLARWFGDIAVRAINGLVSVVMDLSRWWIENRVEARRLMDTLTGIGSSALGTFMGLLGGVLDKLMKLLFWWDFLGTAAKVLAGGAFVGLAMALRSMGGNMVQVGGASGMLTGALHGVMAIVSNLFNVLRGGTTWATFGSSLVSLITPAGLVTAALGALVAIIVSVRAEAQKAAEAVLNLAKAQREAGSKGAQLYNEARTQEAVLKNARATDEERKAAVSALKAIQQQMQELDPQFVRLMQNADGTWKATTAGIKAWAAKMQDAAETGGNAAQAQLNKMRDVQAQLAEWDAKVAAAPAKTKTISGQGLDWAEKRSVAVREVDGQSLTDADIAIWRNRIARGKQFSEEDIKRQQQVVENYREMNKVVAGVLTAEQQITMETQKREPSEKQLRKVEQERHAEAQAALIVENARIRALERGTLDERQAAEIRKEDLRISREIEQIQAAKLSNAEKESAIILLNQEREKSRERIKTEFAEKRAEVEDKLDEMLHKGSLNRFERRMDAVRREVDRVIADYESKTGQKVSAEDRNKMVTFRQEEIGQQTTDTLRMTGMKALGVQEKQQGHKFTLAEEIAWLEKWGEANKLTSEQVAVLTSELRQQEQTRSSWTAGWSEGWSQVLERMGNNFQTMSMAITSVIQGWESAFANFFTMFTQRGTTAAQKWDALWKGLSGAVVQALAKMGAQELLHWTILKAKHLWKMLTTKAEIGMTGAKVAANTTEQASNAATAGTGFMASVANFFKAHSWIPWVGAALAAGFIAMMFSSASQAKSQAKSITANAEGGYYTSATVGLFAEAGPELVAPEKPLVAWIRNMGANLQQDMIQNGRVASAAMNAQGGAPIVVSLAGATILDTSHRGLQKLGEHVLEALRATMPSRNGSLDPGLIFGGN